MFKEKLFRRETADVFVAVFVFNSSLIWYPFDCLGLQVMEEFRKCYLDKNYNFGTALNSKKQSIPKFIWSVSIMKSEMNCSLLLMKITLTAVLYLQEKLLVFSNTHIVK